MLDLSIIAYGPRIAAAEIKELKDKRVTVINYEAATVNYDGEDKTEVRLYFESANGTNELDPERYVRLNKTRATSLTDALGTEFDPVGVRLTLGVAPTQKGDTITFSDVEPAKSAPVDVEL